MADIYNYTALGGSAGKIFYGIHQQNEADKALKELAKQPYAPYLTGEQIYDRANLKSEGLTPAEKAYAQEGINRAATQNYRMLFDRNPSLSGVGQAIVNDKSAMANLSLVAQDAQVKRQSLHSLIAIIGGQANLQTNDLLQRRYQTEAALGAAKQAGAANSANAATGIKNSIGSGIMAGASLGAGGKNSGGGGGDTPYIMPQSSTQQPVNERGFGGVGGTTSSPAYLGGAPSQMGWNGNKTWADYQANYPNMTWQQYLSM